MLEESPVSFHPWFLIGLLDPKVASQGRVLKFAETCFQHYNTNGNETSHPVVFDNLSSLPYAQEVTEAMDILIAGFLHILLNPQVHEKLTKALQDAGLDANNHNSFQLLDLEKIDYMTACVKESLRIGMAVPGRLPRIVPNDLAQPLVVDGQVILPGTVVSMSAYTMHTNEIWGSDARALYPERWLRPDSKNLEQYLCTFSKGARMCIGQNVAYAEITIVMAYLFRCFELRLPDGFVHPKRKDLFTMKYAKPGLPVRFLSI